MKKIVFLSVLFMTIIISGCKFSHNFMDVDNPNAKDDLQHYVSDVKFPEININPDDLVPDSLSGARNEAKGYANRYYEDTLEGYVDKAKEGLSGATQTFKGYYNSGVDELNGIVSDKVNGAISGELNKFKIK